MAMKSKHAFGSEANVDSALESGAIDAFDILFLDECKIGWINKNGEKVILNGKKQVQIVEELPETGDPEALYIYGASFYTWDGTEFKPVSSGEVSETVVDEKVATVKQEANDYTDKAIAEAISVVEF